jgi:hypothetical protein
MSKTMSTTLLLMWLGHDDRTVLDNHIPVAKARVLRTDVCAIERRYRQDKRCSGTYPLINCIIKRKYYTKRHVSQSRAKNMVKFRYHRKEH